MHFASFICLLGIFGFSQGLQNIRISVPKAVRRGDSAVFICDFDLEGEVLYCVKWYKGPHEFFRYTPKDEISMKIFPMEGLDIDKNKSNMTRLTLRNVQPSLSGKYSCEVSAESSFHTQLVSGEMEVVDVPRNGPAIFGVKARYRVGENLSGNCSVEKSYPLVNLTWFINDEQATSYQAKTIPLKSDGHLQLSISRIEFTVTTHHFHSYRLLLRCQASIYNVYQQSAEKIVDEDRIKDSTPLIVQPANFLDDDDDSRDRPRYSLDRNWGVAFAVQWTMISNFFFIVYTAR